MWQRAVVSNGGGVTCANGEITVPSSSSVYNVDIDCAFIPKRITVVNEYGGASNSYKCFMVWDESLGDYLMNTNDSQAITWRQITGSSAGGIMLSAVPTGNSFTLIINPYSGIRNKKLYWYAQI